MADALIELVDVHKQFGDIVAVDGVDLSIRSGEFFSLLGPSGCGKTTCLRMISGFDQPTSGKILFEGQDISHVPPNKRDSNMVFQHLSIFPHMSVKGNVEYGLRKAGVGAAEREKRVASYLDLVNLSGFEDRNPAELSGGQQQRVALARALVNEPSVLLLDEPLSGLDRKLRQHMQVELAKIHHQVEGAFFYVTHDQEVAMTLSDRLAIMRDGQLEQVGSPEEIYHHPKSVFVADFIGDTNLLKGFATTDPKPQVALGGPDGPPLEPSEIESNGPVTVSVRPECISLSAPNGRGLSGTVVDRFFQGDHTDYRVAPNADGLPDLEITVFDAVETFTVGEAVTAMIDEERVHVFPA